MCFKYVCMPWQSFPALRTPTTKEIQVSFGNVEGVWRIQLGAMDMKACNAERF